MGDAEQLSWSVNGWKFSGFASGPADGRVAVLLHGFPQRATAWRPVAERLASRGVRAVAIDQRGYSDGARPEDPAAYALPELVGDVVGLIDQLGGRVDLVGHDWGGVVGWALTAGYPDLVRSWTAISTPHPRALATVLAAEATEPPAEGPSQAQRFAYQALFRQAGPAEAVLLDDDAAQFRALFAGAVAAEQVEREVAFFQRPGVLTAALNWYRGTPAGSSTPPRPVTVPTTYLWGNRDVAFGRAAAEATTDAVRAHYTFVEVDGTHWLLDEVPDIVSSEILARMASTA